MVTSTSVHTVVVALCLCVCAPAQLAARVGEGQDAIEQRLLKPSVGKMIFKSEKGREKDKFGAERDLLHEGRDKPFSDVQKYFPEDLRESVYWKSAVANQLSSDDGWKIHVFYAGGRSVVEAYQRVGDSLSDFEVRALLALNRGTSAWKKVPPETNEERPKQSGKESVISTKGIGYDFELEDGSLRAKYRGNWFMVFSTRVDLYVIEQQKAAKAKSEQQAERNKIEQQNRAPESVAGF